MFSRTELTMAISQIIVIVLFGLFTRFDEQANPKSHGVDELETAAFKQMSQRYPMF